jgi:siroheme synthase
MGVGRLRHLCAGLLAQKFPLDLPVAIVQEAWHPGQRQVFGTLCTIAAIAEAAKVSSPSTIVMGHVVNCLR